MINGKIIVISTCVVAGLAALGFMIQKPKGEAAGAQSEFRTVIPAPPRSEKQAQLSVEFAAATREANKLMEIGQLDKAKGILSKTLAKASDQHMTAGQMFGRTWFDLLMRSGDYDSMLSDEGIKGFSNFHIAARAMKGDWKPVAQSLNPTFVASYLGVKDAKGMLPDIKTEVGTKAFVLLTIGLDYDMEANISSARWYYEAAYRLQPSSPVLATEFAEALLELGDREQAAKVLKSIKVGNDGLKSKVARLSSYAAQK